VLKRIQMSSMSHIKSAPPDRWLPKHSFYPLSAGR
jgi:hypothetical protein